MGGIIIHKIPILKTLFRKSSISGDFSVDKRYFLCYPRGMKMRYKDLSEKINALADYLGVSFVKGGYSVKERKQEIGFKERES